MGAIFAVWMLVYIIFYDKSVYAVDNVYEPFILFLYTEGMLLGALFKKHAEKFTKFNICKLILAIGGLFAYIASKLLVSKIDAVLKLQVINQFIIFIALFLVFNLFISLEPAFKKISPLVNRCVKHISNITLQVYLVQFVIIAHLKNLVFPVNLIVIIVAILAAAFALYYIEYFIRKGISGLIAKGKKEKSNAEGTN